MKVFFKLTLKQVFAVAVLSFVFWEGRWIWAITHDAAADKLFQAWQAYAARKAVLEDRQNRHCSEDAQWSKN